MATAWFLLTVIAVIYIPICCHAGRRSVVRIALRPSSNSNLCVRTRNSALELAPCEDGGQIFDKITVGSNGIQLRLSSDRSNKGTASCVITSFSSSTKNDDTASDDDDDTFETSSSDSTVVTTTCDKKNKFQMWSFRKVGSGIQVINNKTRQCISSDASTGSLLITSKCNKSNSSQLWNALTVKL